MMGGADDGTMRLQQSLVCFPQNEIAHLQLCYLIDNVPIVFRVQLAIGLVVWYQLH